MFAGTGNTHKQLRRTAKRSQHTLNVLVMILRDRGVFPAFFVPHFARLWRLSVEIAIWERPYCPIAPEIAPDSVLQEVISAQVTALLYPLIPSKDC